MSTSSVTLQIRLVRVSLDTTLYCQELIACSDGRPFKRDPWMLSSSMLTPPQSPVVLKPMSILPKIESCVFRSTSNKTQDTIYPSFPTQRPSLMHLRNFWFWWSREEDGRMVPCSQLGELSPTSVRWSNVKTPNILANASLEWSFSWFSTSSTRFSNSYL